MGKLEIVLVTNKEGLDTLCKKKIFVELIQRKWVADGHMIDKVAGGIYTIICRLPIFKESRFITEEFADMITSLKYFEYVSMGKYTHKHVIHIPDELAKEVKPYLAMKCDVAVCGKMAEEIDFGVDNENEHPWRKDRMGYLLLL